MPSISGLFFLLKVFHLKRHRNWIAFDKSAFTKNKKQKVEYF